MGETRKLAAILVSDVVGYSRLAGADEDRTLARLRALRSDLIDPTISVHHGRIVKRTGDGSVIEFRSVVDAVRCAIEVQHAMVERNAGVALEKRIEFRIGIHLGDVVEESDGDLMGDGVNIAARLEGIAKPGAICLSEDAYRQVRDKVKEKFVDLGEKELKNIARPVRVYGVPLRPTDASNEPSTILDRPSIAVLAFNNMSGDPSQEFIADGITEDVTALLSRLPDFFVIARNTTFTYKGRAVDTRQVARELGVRYVLEGSVQKAGQRIRVTAQLIEANSGNHVWAEKYDRELEDLFVVQDEITHGIFAALKTHLLLAEAELAKRKPPQSLDAWGYTVRASAKWHHVTPETSSMSWRSPAERSTCNPTMGRPMRSCRRRSVSDPSPRSATTSKRSAANRWLRRARRSNSTATTRTFCWPRASPTFLGLLKRSHGLLERAVELNPNNAMACAALGNLSPFLVDQTRGSN